MTPRRPRHGVWFLVLLGCAAAETRGGEMEDRFRAANRSYEQGSFPAAVRDYEAILGAGVRSPVLHFNLGNAYFRQNDLGRALLNYERALLLAPGDREIRQNLEFARSLIHDRIATPPPPPPMDILISVHRRFTPNAATVLFLLAYLGGSGFLTGYLLSGAEPRKKVYLYGMTVLVILMLILGLTLGGKLYNAGRRVHAIILDDRVEVRSGPGVDQTVLFTIHEGLRARVRSRRPEWLQISLPNGWNGWIPSASAGII